MEEHRPRKLVAIDLFCGVGGMSLGFEQAGFGVAAAVDNDPIQVEYYNQNFPTKPAFYGDLCGLSGQEIRKEAGLKKRKIDVVFGGPPCQGFSVGGKRRTDDPRNGMLAEFARLVIELKPSYFVVENVRGMMFNGSRSALDSFLETVEKKGYKVTRPIQCLNSKDFGVPQRRDRVFVLGSKEGLTALTYPSIANEAERNVFDAIGDLTVLGECEEVARVDVYRGPLGSTGQYGRLLRGEIREAGDHSTVRPTGDGLSGCLRTIHSEEARQRFEETAPGSYEAISRFYRLSWKGLSRTLRGGTMRCNGSFTAPRPIHPSQARCITVREGARLHSFPDWFVFHPTRWRGFYQVGNSVPPLLARAVALCVSEVLHESEAPR